MTKKISSTYDEFVKSLSPQQKKEFNEGYKDILLSEMIIAAMQQDDISVRKLAKLAGISPTIIQGMRSGTRKNFSMQTFFKVLNILGYQLVVEKNGMRFPIDFSHSDKK